MHAMQGRWTLGLSVVLLGLVGALWWAGEAPVSRDEAATVPMWAFSPDDVVAGTVVTGDGTVRFERVDGAWALTVPVSAPADEGRIDQVLRDLARNPMAQPVASAETNGEPYGLGATPEVSIALELTGGGRMDLQLGREAPAGYLTYARAPDGQIAAVHGRLADRFAGPPIEWRDHRVWRFDAGLVRRVTLEGPPGSVTVRGEGQDWWIDGGGRADASVVDDLVTGLLDVHFARFGTAPDVPWDRRAVVGFADGTERVLRVLSLDVEAEVPVVADDVSGVVRAPELAILGMGPADLTDRRAFPLEPADVASLQLDLPGRSWRAERDGEAWRVAGVEDGAARERVAALLASRKEPLGGASPPDAPVAWVVVTLGGGDRTVVVEVGPVVDGFHVARERAGGAPYRVRELATLTQFADTAVP